MSARTADEADMLALLRCRSARVLSHSCCRFGAFRLDTSAAALHDADAACAGQHACAAQQGPAYAAGQQDVDRGCRGFASTTAAASPSSTQFASDGRIAPHGGGPLVNRMIGDAAAAAELLASCQGRVLHCSDRNACDVELLLGGGFTPLEGFMGQAAYESVVQHMRLPDGQLFGLPVVLDARDTEVRPGQRVLLAHAGRPLAVMEVESAWEPDKAAEAVACYGTASLEHPGVRMLAGERGPRYLGGRIHGLGLPQWVFPCQTAAEVRAALPPHIDVVAFQCRNPVHRAHYELFTRSLAAPNVGSDAVCLVHPTCGPTQDDDIPGIVRYHTYEVLKAALGNERIRWAYLPYSMHMAGPREAIQHMLIRKNYGCTHFIIGRDMAGSKSCLTGEDFYGPFEAQEFAQRHAPELGLQTVCSPNIVHTQEAGYVTAEAAAASGHKVQKLSGTKFRQMLRAGEDIPEWFAFPHVVAVLRAHLAAAPPKPLTAAPGPAASQDDGRRSRVQYDGGGIAAVAA